MLDSLTLVPEGRGTAPAGGEVGRPPDLALWVGPPLSTKRRDKGKLLGLLMGRVEMGFMGWVLASGLFGWVRTGCII